MPSPFTRVSCLATISPFFVLSRTGTVSRRGTVSCHELANRGRDADAGSSAACAARTPKRPLITLQYAQPMPRGSGDGVRVIGAIMAGMSFTLLGPFTTSSYSRRASR